MTKKELIFDMVWRARFNNDFARAAKDNHAISEYYKGKKDAYMLAARRIKGVA